jgi:hypothetical protein
MLGRVSQQDPPALLVICVTGTIGLNLILYWCSNPIEYFPVHNIDVCTGSVHLNMTLAQLNVMESAKPISMWSRTGPTIAKTYRQTILDIMIVLDYKE